MKRGDVVIVEFSEGGRMIAWFRGMQNHNGVDYSLVSPFDNSPPNSHAHWIDKNGKSKITLFKEAA